MAAVRSETPSLGALIAAVVLLIATIASATLGSDAPGRGRLRAMDVDQRAMDVDLRAMDVDQSAMDVDQAAEAARPWASIENELAAMRRDLAEVTALVATAKRTHDAATLAAARELLRMLAWRSDALRVRIERLRCDRRSHGCRWTSTRIYSECANPIDARACVP